MNPSFILLHSHQHLASLVPIVLTGVQWPSLEILILAFLISGAMFSGAYCYLWIISSRFILESYWDKVLLHGWVCLWTHFVAQDDFELLSYLNLHRAGLIDTYDHACFHIVNFQLAFNFIFSIFVFQDLFFFFTDYDYESLSRFMIHNLFLLWDASFNLRSILAGPLLYVVVSSLGLPLGRQTLTLDAQESLNGCHLYTIVRKFSWSRRVENSRIQYSCPCLKNFLLLVWCEVSKKPLLSYVFLIFCLFQCLWAEVSKMVNASWG